MKKYFFGLIVLLMLPTITVAAEQQVLVDQVVGPYHVVATIEPLPLTIGFVDVNIAVKDAVTGEPRPITAAYVTIRSERIGESEQFLAPSVGDRGEGRFRSHRLHFPVSGNWNVAVQLLEDGQITEHQTTVYVRPVTARIFEAARLAVPLTLIGMVAAWFGWRWWRRLQANSGR